MPLKGLLQMLLNLSSSNKKWIADKLYKSVREEEMEKEHDEECLVLFSAFEQVKELREGHLKTRDVEELLNECEDKNNTKF